jgi:hypothetical protein
MLKKSLIFGTVALFLAALIALTGCAQATDSEASSGGSSKGWNSLYGTMTPFEVQQVIDKAVAQGVAVYLEDGLTIKRESSSLTDLPGTINFKTVAVRINGKVTVESGTVISTAQAASVQGEDGASLGLDGTYISGHGPGLTYIGNPVVVEYIPDVSKPTETAEAIAVSKYTLGPFGGNDYTTGAPIPVRSGVQTIYVLDELVVPVNGVVQGGDLKRIVALGTVDFIGSPDSAFLNGPKVGENQIVLGSSATVTSSSGQVELTLPATGTLPIVDVKENQPIVIKGSTSLAISAVNGKGVLRINGENLVAVTVEGGDGNVLFTQNQDTGSDPFKINNTGTAVFAGSVKLIEGSVIAGDAVFQKGVEVAVTPDDDAVSFGGDVTLWHVGLNVLTADPVLTIAQEGAIALSPNKSVKVGGETLSAGTGTGNVPATVIFTAKEGGVKLVAGTSADLKFVSGIAAKTDEKAIAAAKQLILIDEDLGIVGGTLEVGSEATFVIYDQAVIPRVHKVKADRIRSNSGYLAVADGGTISLKTADAGSGAVGEIKIGLDSSDAGEVAGISYDGVATAAGVLKAAGGTITFGFEEITGTAGAALNVSGVPVFAVTEGKDLRLNGLNLNLAGVGTGGGLALPEPVSGTDPKCQVILLNSGKITLDTKDGVPNTRTTLVTGSGAAAVRAAFSGIGAVALGASEKTGANLISLAASTTATVTISGPDYSGTSTFTFAKGAVKFE